MDPVVARVDALARSLHERHGRCTRNTIDVLTALAEHGAAASIGDIARLLLRRKSRHQIDVVTITRTLARLITAGLVCSVPDEHPRRRYALTDR